MLKESLRNTLAELTALDGVSGFEQDVVRHLREAFGGLADSVDVDSMGNLYATRQGATAGPSLLVTAHSDEIGGIVKSVDRRGFLRFDPLGGILPAMLVGRRVRVRGHLGVIGVKSGHLQTAEEKGRVLHHRLSVYRRGRRDGRRGGGDGDRHRGSGGLLQPAGRR